MLLKKQLDPELVLSLDKDGDGVDKCEFVVGMLVKLEMVRPALPRLSLAAAVAFSIGGCSCETSVRPYHPRRAGL